MARLHLVSPDEKAGYSKACSWTNVLPITPPVTDACCSAVAQSWCSQDTLSSDVLHILHVLIMRSSRTRQKRIQLPIFAHLSHITLSQEQMRRAGARQRGVCLGPLHRISQTAYALPPPKYPRCPCKLTADIQLHLNSTDTTKLGSSQHFNWSIQTGVPTRLWPVKHISCITQILPWVFRGSSSGSNALKDL